MKHLLAVFCLLAAVCLPQATAADYYLVTTNYSSQTNVYATNIGPTLRLTGGGAVGVSITIANTNVVTNTFYYQTTVDGTNWGTTNATFSVVVVSDTNVVGLVTTTNAIFTQDQLSGFSGFRLHSHLRRQTNSAAIMGITNSYGMWR